MLLISLDPVPLAFRPTTIKLRVSVHLRGGWGMGLKEETAGGVRGGVSAGGAVSRGEDRQGEKGRSRESRRGAG